MGEEETEKPDPPKVRPKSAHKGIKHKRESEKIQCKLVTICPELTTSPESKGWHEGKRQRGKPKTSPKVGQFEFEGNAKCAKNAFPVMRPKTAPSKRPCCVIRSDLPQYNGFRSEYGLSAQQLEERKLWVSEYELTRNVSWDSPFFHVSGKMQKSGINGDRHFWLSWKQSVENYKTMRLNSRIGWKKNHQNRNLPKMSKSTPSLGPTYLYKKTQSMLRNAVSLTR